MSRRRGRRFSWVDGAIEVSLPDDEAEMLRHVFPQLRDLVMAGDDDALRRLNPPAHADDPEAEEAYRALVDDDLLRARLEAIELVESSIEGAQLDEEAIGAWMQSLNGLRLVLGERLDVDILGHEELHDLEEDDPRVPIVVLYEWLGFLLEDLVDAAMGEFGD